MSDTPPKTAPARSVWGPWWWLLTAGYLGAALASAWVKPVWYDETFTIELAKLGPGELWAALAGATDLNPPGSYLLTKPFLSLGLPDPVAARLVPVLAFYAMMAGVYRFAARGDSPGAGLVAALVALCTAAFVYSFEARPYALVLGGTGAALAFWQAAGAGARWARVGLAVAVAVAVTSHYYGAFAVAPLFAGEAVRTLVRRRLDWRTWLALGVGVLPVVALVPLVREQKAYAGLFPVELSWGFAQEVYRLLFGRAIIPALGGLVLLAVWPSGQRPAPDDERPASDRWAEAIVLLGLLAVPVVELVIAKRNGSALGLRYTLPAIVGGAAAAGLAVRRVGLTLPRTWQPFALALVGWFAVTAGWDWLQLRAADRELQEAFAWVSASEYGDAPVVTAEPLTYPQWRGTAPPAVKARLKYVPNPQAMDLYHNQKKYTLDGAYLTLEKYRGPFDVVSLADVARGRDRVLIYGNPARGWVAGGFLGNGWTLTKVKGSGMHALYVAERPKGETRP